MAASNTAFFLSESQTTRLRALASELEQPSLLWASGFLAGLASAKAEGVPYPVPLTAANAPAAEPAEAKTLTIIYGSQTGNAKRVAEQLANDAKAASLAVNIYRADSYKPQQLKKERLLYVVISTHSEGDIIDPPDDSRDFIEFLEGRRAPKLPDLRYAVLALGDTSYPDFCGIGRKVDERLEALGASRIQPRGDADVDIDTVAKPWVAKALETAREELKTDAGQGAASSAGGVVTLLHPRKSAWTRDNPFLAEILTSQRIVGAGSVKDVHHIELSLEDSGISYKPGDALGVWPRQAADLVTAVIAELGLDAEQQITQGDVTLSLADWLTERRELTLLTRPFIVAHAERGDHADLRAVLEPEGKAELSELLGKWQLLDFLRRWPVSWDAEALVAALRPLAPRMYSIASSQTLVGEEVHLTVERLHYQRDGEDRWGVATRYLCGLEEGEKVSVFIDENDCFRLPQDPSRDIILIGPGTGIAPFRAFVQEREKSGAEGRQWLFFGNPNRRTDFLYQLEWQQAVKNGVLTRLSVAFSRDQEHKIYVQDRLRENAAEVWNWLEGGAHLYICGDADRMAPDVHTALVDIVTEQGGLSEEDAGLYLKKLMSDGRYARDVY